MQKSLPKEKIGKDFCLQRQLHSQSAVTYVYVSSLACKFASLPCRLFQPLQSVDFVNALRDSSNLLSLRNISKSAL